MRNDGVCQMFQESEKAPLFLPAIRLHIPQQAAQAESFSPRESRVSGLMPETLL
jgi:hypothetical protein